MKQKMSILITKLTNKLMKYYEVHMYFHIYLLKSVFFGTGIMSMTLEQNKDL